MLIYSNEPVQAFVYVHRFAVKPDPDCADTGILRVVVNRKMLVLETFVHPGQTVECPGSPILLLPGDMLSMTFNNSSLVCIAEGREPDQLSYAETLKVYEAARRLQQRYNRAEAKMVEAMRVGTRSAPPAQPVVKRKVRVPK